MYLKELIVPYYLSIILRSQTGGVSPRATIALDRCARANAWLSGRDYVTPQDVQKMAFPVLRHRLLLTYNAKAEGITADHIIQNLIEQVTSV